MKVEIEFRDNSKIELDGATSTDSGTWGFSVNFLTYSDIFPFADIKRLKIWKDLPK